MPKQESIYYSLDIETSGFDPSKNEILEIGLVGFKLDKGRFKVVEEWSAVFRPKIEVSAHVLGLTGITAAELESGKKLSDHLFFLQNKLGQANIVGHNVGFDVGFLEQSGLKFSGNIIDTMDLVQCLLPTHHSYNLENLMHTFNVAHTEAHRALPDAKATCTLLQRLLGIYQNLPEKVKEQSYSLALAAGEPWAELLIFPAKPVVWPSKAVIKKRATKKKQEGLISLEHKSCYVAKNFTPVARLASQLVERTNVPILLVVPKRYQVLELWKGNVAHGVFEPQQGFNVEKFEALLQARPLSLDQAKFLIKLLVWQATNWQNECLLDLNLSFFGGQFKEAVSGRPLPEQLPDRVVCCDHRTFLELKDEKIFQGRSLVILDQPEFERAITGTLGERSSWGYILYLLRSIYDPETGSGRTEVCQTIEQLLADTDLFFGLANALLLKFNQGWGEITVEARLRNSEEYSKILRAAVHFREKLLLANASLNSKELARFCQGLENFFVDQSSQVKWVSFGERSCSFHSLPLDISPIVKESFHNFKTVCFMEQPSMEIVRNYFIARLGLEDFALRSWVAPAAKFFQKVAAKFDQGPIYELSSLKTEDLVQTLRKSSLPAAIIYETPGEIGDVYKKHYKTLKSQAFLLAEQQGGGTNKLLRNFVIHSNSLLLITGKTVLNFLYNLQQVQPVTALPAKLLVFMHVEPVIDRNPYAEAMARQYSDPDKEYHLPRALYNFQSILQFFHTPSLKQVILQEGKNTLKYKGLYRQCLEETFKSQS